MHDASFMELETNISFNCQIDEKPAVKQNYTYVFIGKKKVKRPTTVERNGKIVVSYTNLSSSALNFLKKWALTKKRIDLMIETAENIYMIKRSYIKEFKPDEDFTVIYNDFRES